MKNFLLPLTIIAMTILVGCRTVSRHRDFTGVPATDFTVSVTCGEPSMEFTGTIVSDGQTEHLSGTGSGTFQISGHEVVCVFRKSDPAGRIALKITKAGELVGQAMTDVTNGGVRAELLYTPEQQHTLFTSFR